MPDKQYIFLVGAPRSGSTWLHMLLSEHPDVVTTLEYPVFHRYITPLIKQWKIDTAQLNKAKQENIFTTARLSMFWNEEKFYTFIRDFFISTLKPIEAKNPSAKVHLIKDPNNALDITEIHTLFPRAKFIHLIRDGRDVAASLVAAKKDMGFGEPSVRSAIRAWKDLVEHAEKSAKKLGSGLYTQVFYEDMVEQPVETLKKVLEFCGISFTQESLQSTTFKYSFESVQKGLLTPDPAYKNHPHFFRKGTPGSWKQDLNWFEKAVCAWEANELLLRYGYVKNPRWYLGSSK